MGQVGHGDIDLDTHARMHTQTDRRDWRHYNRRIRMYM